MDINKNLKFLFCDLKVISFQKIKIKLKILVKFYSQINI